MQTATGYNHRALGPSLQVQPSRLSELLDFVKQEVDGLNNECHQIKLQNLEHEGHASNHLAELQALRHSFMELEREFQKSKDRYEDEIRNLKRELDARSGHPPSTGPSASNPSNLPPPKVGFGPGNLFGGLMGNSATNPNAQPSASAGPSTPTAPSALPPHQGPPGGEYPAYGNGWTASDRERDQLYDAEQRAKHPDAMRLDPKPLSSNPPSVPPSGPTPVSGRPGPPPNYAHPPPPLRAPFPPSAPSALRPVSPLLERDRPPPQTPSSATMIEMDPETVPREMKKEGTDWVTMYNPKVRRTLDVELVHTLQHDSVVCCVRFSPDGKILATGCNRNTNLYDTKTGAKQCVLVDDSIGSKSDNYIRSACFSPDGKLIATGSEDRIIRIWDIPRKRIKCSFHGHKSEIYSLAFSPDGKQLVSGSGDKTAKVWDMESGKLAFTLTIDDVTLADNGPVDAGVTSVALSPDGSLLAAGSLDTVVRIWDAKTGQPLDRLKGHKDSVYSVAFAPDGKWLVSGSLDKTLKIWDLTTLRNKLIKGELGPLDGSVEEVRTTCMTTLTGHKDYVLSVAVSPDGAWIVSGSKDRGVSFWDPKSAAAAVVLQGHKNSVISIAVADVGGLFATGSGDWSCRVWRMDRLQD